MIILGWDRDHEDETWPQFDHDRAFLQRTRGSIDTSWTVGNHKDIQRGEACFMYAQGAKHPRGIVALGKVTGEPEKHPHYDNARAARGDTTNWIPWRIMAMLPKDDPIPRDVLEDRVPDVPWRHIYSSGFYVPPGSEGDLMDLFIEYCPDFLEE